MKIFGDPRPETEELSLQQLPADFPVLGRKTYEGMAAYWKNEKVQLQI